MDKLENREIVELLIDRGELSLPKIAELLDANVGSVDYHLKVLIEKGIVQVKKKSYGSKYYVPDSLTALSKRMTWELSASLVFLFSGVFLAFTNLPFAALCLLVSSVIGAFSTIASAIRQRKEKIKAVLQAL